MRHCAVLGRYPQGTQVKDRKDRKTESRKVVASYSYDLKTVAGLYEKRRRKTQNKMTEIIMIYR